MSKRQKSVPPVNVGAVAAWARNPESTTKGATNTSPSVWDSVLIGSPEFGRMLEALNDHFAKMSRSKEPAVAALGREGLRLIALLDTARNAKNADQAAFYGFELGRLSMGWGIKDVAEEEFARGMRSRKRGQNALQAAKAANQEWTNQERDEWDRIYTELPPEWSISKKARVIRTRRQQADGGVGVPTRGRTQRGIARYVSKKDQNRTPKK